MWAASWAPRSYSGWSSYSRISPWTFSTDSSIHGSAIRGNHGGRLREQSKGRRPEAIGPPVFGKQERGRRSRHLPPFVDRLAFGQPAAGTHRVDGYLLRHPFSRVGDRRRIRHRAYLAQHGRRPHDRLVAPLCTLWPKPHVVDKGDGVCRVRDRRGLGSVEDPLQAHPAERPPSHLHPNLARCWHSGRNFLRARLHRIPADRCKPPRTRVHHQPGADVGAPRVLVDRGVPGGDDHAIRPRGQPHGGRIPGRDRSAEAKLTWPPRSRSATFRSTSTPAGASSERSTGGISSSGKARSSVSRAKAGAEKAPSASRS